MGRDRNRRRRQQLADGLVQVRHDVVDRPVDHATGNFDPEAGIGLFSGIFALLSLIPAIIVHIKRFHDRDKSGWWVLIGLVPIIGAIWLLIELGFFKGTPGPNRFGPPVTD